MAGGGTVGGNSPLRGPAEFENMDCFGGGGDAEEGGGCVEGHAVYARGHGAAAELVEFLGGGDAEDADDGAFVGRGGEEGACVVEGNAGEGRAVRFGHVDGFEF